MSQLDRLLQNRSETIFQHASIVKHESGIEFLAIEANRNLIESKSIQPSKISYHLENDLHAFKAAEHDLDECQLFFNLNGQIKATVNYGNWSGPLQRIQLPGSGFHKMHLNESGVFHGDFNDQSRWSRVTGALGHDSWDRLRQQTYAVIGLGRIGSMLTNDLARLGVRSVVGIDPDKLEIWNIDSMDGATMTNIGQTKTSAIDSHFRNIWATGKFVPVPYAIESPYALNQCKEADVLFSCTDNEYARFTSAILATFYHRPIIEVGTGILSHNGIKHQGIEIHTIMPDADGCPVCLSGAFESDKIIKSNSFEEGERLGSLRSLNHIAVGHAISHLEFLAQETLSPAIFLRLNLDSTGDIHWQFTHPERQNKTCTFCSYKGTGDTGLRYIDDLRRLYLNHAI
jgi:molybdopterin/thiamine biosynthesis adenylyltransferase